jgi:SAM-dependent MidA family methyltransferase
MLVHVNTVVATLEPAHLEAFILAEIERQGPMHFDRFMDLALYSPGRGYYVRGDDPFGAQGDFYTAEQLQPVFGILIAQFAASLKGRMGQAADFRVVELGAGRGEMAGALADYSYTPVELGNNDLPAGSIRGMVFANEFFDALPVRVAVRRDGQFRDVLVSAVSGRFEFVDGSRCDGTTLDYLNRFYAGAEDDTIVEVHLRALEWLDRIASALDGCLLIVDYGYTSREFARFTGGTLMSYHRHTASSEVLSHPGQRDITAHVPFTVVEEHLRQRGLIVESLQTLASFLLSVGEPDQFAAALAANDEQEAQRRRMQLKTLLFGMGETFRVLVANSATK